jgi:hypothetical protein
MIKLSSVLFNDEFILFSFNLLLMTMHSHYHIERKRSAVEVYREAKRIRKDVSPKNFKPVHLASIAAGGASDAQIFAWLKEDLLKEAQETKIENRGAERLLSEDQQMLLVGFALSERSSLEPVSLRA